MNFATFKETLLSHPDVEIELKFADGNSVAPHFHITEVGKVTKDFVDCGGTRRLTESCMLQTLVANDVEHRLLTTKLAGVLDLTKTLGLEDLFPVEAEVQADTVGVYTISGGAIENGKLVFDLVAKQTACLAPSACSLDGAAESPVDVIPISQAPLAAPEDSGCCGGTSGG